MRCSRAKTDAQVKGGLMRLLLTASLLAMSFGVGSAQTRDSAMDHVTDISPSGPPQVEDRDIGFSYSLPADWQTQVSQPAPVAVPYPEALEPTKGNSCAQVKLTARRGTPASVIVVVVLPFACYGQSMTEKDLPAFAAGASEGLKQAFELSEPVLSGYSLGSHSMWAERVKGTVKGKPESQYTVEIACTVMKKGAACWMTIAADAGSLQAFENEKVTLEGELYSVMVPAGAFESAPVAAQK